MSIAIDLRLPALAGLVVTALAAATPARAQVPVIDGAAIAEAAQTAQAAAEQVQHLTSMLQEVQGIMRSIGQEGLPTVLLREGLDQVGGLSGFAAPIRDLVDGGAAVWGAAQEGMTVYNSLQDILGEARRLKGQAESLATAPDFSSVASAHAWVKQELTVARNASASTVALTRRAREVLAGEAAMNAYALALSARESVSRAAERTEALAEQAASTQTLRSDMAANTAVMLAMHDQMVQIQALLASVLEVRATDHMATSEPFAAAVAAN
jgi:hypothetical protein